MCAGDTPRQTQALRALPSNQVPRPASRACGVVDDEDACTCLSFALSCREWKIFCRLRNRRGRRDRRRHV
jgi:hypothetical protein